MALAQVLYRTFFWKRKKKLENSKKS
ncbi:unnamed protein product, partial [Cuscuta campestris]